MASLSFDPVAHLYDETRGYPQEVAVQVAQAIDATVMATEQTTFLEIGAGTGRIGFPLASLGRMYTGLDISEKMLSRFEHKLQQAGWLEHGCELLPWGSLLDEQVATDGQTPLIRRFTHAQPPSSVRLLLADAEHLPFRSQSFDVALAVHVLHLMDNWQQALQELLRVLRPRATLLLCRDGGGKSSSISVHERWRALIKGQGITDRQGAVYEHDVVVWLQQQRMDVEEVCACTWEREVVPRDEIAAIAQRSYSRSWHIPEPAFSRSIEQLTDWAQKYYGNLDQPVRQERTFVITQVQMPYRTRPLADL